MDGLIDEQKKFLSKTFLDGDCISWSKGKDGAGYGMLRVNGKQMRSHRRSYELFIGKIPKGLLVCHKCDNRKCVKPEHLFLGTHRDNIVDCTNKGRNPLIEKRKKTAATMTHCKNGHAWVEENIYSSPKNGRMCRRCNSISSKERYWKRKINE